MLYKSFQAGGPVAEPEPEQQLSEKSGAKKSEKEKKVLSKTRSHQTVMYKCIASGPQNNGKLPRCNFSQEFPDKEDLYNCPQCGNKLVKADDIDSQ